MRKSILTKGLLCSTVLTGALASAMPAFAQDEGGSKDTIIVTGSRIQRGDLEAPSPVTVVGAEDLSLSNTVNSEQFLNTLPQAVPGFDSSSNNPGIGEATVDLRGLGSIRTLVLVNGRRYVSSNQNPGVVDLNTIPTALVERVDILTGGASAVYGSDAMAGVVNFVLKDDFEGLSLDNSYEISEKGDADIYNGSLTLGGNFADGRGNVVMNVGYTYRAALLQGERDEAFFSLSDTGAAGGFANTGSVNIPSTFVFDTTPDFTAAGIDTPPCALEGSVLDAGACTTETFGWIFNPGGAGATPFINSGPNTNRYNYAPVNYLQIPQERYNIYTSGRYEITDNMEAYAQAIYVSSQTEQLLAPTPVFTTITVNLDNPFLAGDAQSLALLSAISGGTDTDGNGVNDAQILTGRRSLELGGRLSDVRNDSFQIQGGLRGTIDDNWNWDVFASFGQAETTVTQTGNVLVPAYQAAIRENRANIFIEGGLTPDIVDEISVVGAITGTTEQTVISGSVDGEIEGFASPWAETNVGVALGVEYREESLETLSTGLGPDIVGFNQAPDTSGSFDVYEVFGEVSIPIVEDVTGFEELSLNGAVRYSDYSTVGGVVSWAGGASWTVYEGIRFRGQYQRAVRAPNVGELFAPQTNGFPNIADPCSGGLGSFATVPDPATTTAQCVANGVPSAAVGTPFQVNAQIEGLFGGNPDLSEETSDTFTVGVVLEPSMIDNLSITVDYFDISIDDVIGVVPSQELFNLCFVDAVDEFCSQITRFPSGAVDIFNSSNLNSADLGAKGIDISIDYSMDLGEFGTLSAYSLITRNIDATFQALPTSDVIDCVGFYGATCGEPTHKMRYNTRFDWELGDYGARLRWTHVGGVRDDLFLDGGTPDLFVEGVGGYNQVDLTGYWNATENVFVSFGIENLLDTDYVLIGDDAAEQSNTFPATYDTIGRTFFGRVVLNF